MSITGAFRHRQATPSPCCYQPHQVAASTRDFNSRNTADGNVLPSDIRSGGTGQDAFLSQFAIVTSGTYFIRAFGESSTVGNYELSLQVARGIDQESDSGYANDTLTGADAITLTPVGVNLTSTIAGTIMQPAGGNPDADVFRLGTFSAGNTVELSIDLPSSSTLVPYLRLMDAAGTTVPDSDGNLFDAHVLATLPADGEYFAEVRALAVYDGHSYPARRFPQLG